MILSSIISCICFISTLMLVWFKSDAFIEYASLFGLKKLVKVQEYKDAKLENIYLTYPLFLKLKYDKFIFRLIGCKLCFSIWCSGFVSLWISHSILNFIGYTSVLCILSLFIFGYISKLLDENK
jgi:hypothetical protein